MHHQFLNKILRTLCVALLGSHIALGAESVLWQGGQYYKSHGLRIKPTDVISQKRLTQDKGKAERIIDGVVEMYGQDVKLGTLYYTLKTDSIVSSVNASYTHSTKTFDLPYVRKSDGRLFATSADRGIVSHEGGHMILSYLLALSNTSHTAALHEAFGDLTAHFYRFYNPGTRQKFLENLTNDEGCVGDTPFSCTRNSSQPLRLLDVSRNTSLCESHEFSKPFTTAIYGNMTTYYQNRGILSRIFTWGESDAESIVSWHRNILVNAILSLESQSPTLMDVAKAMLVVSYEYNLYRDGLGRSFINNGLIVLIYQQPSYRYEANPKYRQLCLLNKNKRGT